MNQKNIFIGIGLLIVLIYALGSGHYVSQGTSWYNALNKPAWQPPDWLFGVAWSYNFIVLAVAAVMLPGKLTKVHTIIYFSFLAASIAFALFWSYTFYVPHELSLSAIILAIAAFTNVPAYLIAKSASKSLGYLLLPYQAWLFVATSLAIGYAIQN